MNSKHSNVNSVFYILFIILLMLTATSATAKGFYLSLQQKFDCEFINENANECAKYYEHTFIKKHGKLVKRTKKGLEITLKNRSKKLIEDNDNSIMALELSPKGRFIIMRYHFEEGNGWEVFDLLVGKASYIPGYPLFNHDESRFVVVELGLDNGSNTNTLDVFSVSNSSIKNVFKGINEEYADTHSWGPTDVKWIGNRKISFNKTILNIGLTDWADEDIYVKEPAFLSENRKGKWVITFKK